jgi:hypothetical protein
MTMGRVLLMAFCLLLTGAHATAQTAKDLVGTYMFGHEVREVDGKQTTIEAKGVLVFDANANYTLTIIAPNVPKVASNNRMTATPEEAKTIVAATTAHFGTFSVNDNNLIFRIERASFPNWNGIEQKRTFKFNGDELQYSVAAASGGGSITLTWKRVK